MKKFFKAIFLTVLLNTAVFAASLTPQEQQVMDVTQSWAAAINSHNLTAIDALYDNDAVIYATYKNELNTPDQIKGYFKGLFAKKDFKVEFVNQKITVTENMAVNSGNYIFSYVDNNNQLVKVKARYSFIYLLTHNDGWKIINHHSSALPEEPVNSTASK